MVHKLFGGAARHPATDPFMTRLATILDHHDVGLVLDVGANEGQFARALRGAGYDRRIVSFEPVARTHAVLAGRTGDLWEAHPRLALGAAAGEAAIHTFNRTDMSSLLPAREAAHEAFPKLAQEAAEIVPVARLDALFDGLHRGEVTHLKIDTQGFEHAVITGAAGCLDRIAGIQVEVGVAPLYEGQPSHLELFAMIEDAGFEPVLFSPGNFSKRLCRQLDFDVVFFRNP